MTQTVTFTSGESEANEITGVQTALWGLLGIGSNNVSVSGSGSSFTITVSGSLKVLPILTVTGPASLGSAKTSSSTTTEYLYVSPPTSGTPESEFVLTDGTSYTELSIYSSASDIQTALDGFASINLGNSSATNVTVTAIAGQPGEFEIQAAGTLSTLPTLSAPTSAPTPTIAQNVLPFAFPTVQGIVNVLNTALANALAGTPISIQAGFDPTGEILTLTVQLTFSASTQETLSLGSGFSALGFTLGGSPLTATLSAGATLNFTLGLNLSGISSSDPLPAASDFYVQFNQVEVNGSISFANINLGVTGNIGSASGSSLAIVNGSASLTGAVNLGFGTPLISGDSVRKHRE